MTKTSKKIPNKPVIITTQTFREAGGLELFPNLEMGNSFSARKLGDEDGGESSARNKANSELRQMARRRGYTHLFGVRYKFDEYGHPSRGYAICTTTGTGYKPRGQL